MATRATCRCGGRLVPSGRGERCSSCGLQSDDPILGWDVEPAQEAETCRCGQWPIEEYGELCPSCEVDHVMRAEPALALGGWAVFCACGKLTGFAPTAHEADLIHAAHVKRSARKQEDN